MNRSCETHLFFFSLFIESLKISFVRIHSFVYFQNWWRWNLNSCCEKSSSICLLLAWIWFLLLKHLGNLQINIDKMWMKILFRNNSLGYSNYFLMGCVARGLKSYPYLRMFPLKNGWFDCFFNNFENWDPFLRGFSPQKWPIFKKFCNFCKRWPSFKDFMTKWNPCLRFLLLLLLFCFVLFLWWKTNPFVQYIPVYLNMWVPPPPRNNHITMYAVLKGKS